jgi:hypothetical protein
LVEGSIGNIDLEAIGLALSECGVDGGHFDIRGCDFIFKRRFGEKRIFSQAGH